MNNNSAKARDSLERNFDVNDEEMGSESISPQKLSQESTEANNNDPDGSNNPDQVSKSQFLCLFLVK